MAGDGPSILGPSVLSAAQIAGGSPPRDTTPGSPCPFGQLVADYFKAAGSPGVRADIAFAQSVIETGYFSFPSYGQDAPEFNNFAGIGACDTCKTGWRFPSAMTGVLSQEELLRGLRHASPPGGRLRQTLRQFRDRGVLFDVDGARRYWASSPAYGYDILKIYNEMLAWALPRELGERRLVPKPAPAGHSPASRPVKSSPAPSRTRPDMMRALQ